MFLVQQRVFLCSLRRYYCIPHSDCVAHLVKFLLVYHIKTPIRGHYINLALSWLRLRNVVFSKFNRLLSRCQLSRLLNPRLCGNWLRLSNHLSILLSLLLLLLCLFPLFASNISAETAHLLLLGLLFNYLEFS